MLTYRNGHIPGYLVPRKPINGNLRYLSHFVGKALPKSHLVRHKTHSIVSPICANSRLSEYITFWVQEFKTRKFKAERKSVLREF